MSVTVSELMKILEFVPDDYDIEMDLSCDSGHIVDKVEVNHEERTVIFKEKVYFG